MRNIKIFKKGRRAKRSKRIVIAFGITIFCFLFYVTFYRIITTLKENGITEQRDNSVYFRSLFQNNPIEIQNSFADDVEKGINDTYTKADAYFITRRYIDNGGNIYEIYDYVNSHPELAFLKEAEDIYPKTFELVSKRRLPFTYSDDGMYAYLAYAEIVEKYGYADIATRGTVANQYMTMAYYKRMIREDKSDGKSFEYPDYTESDIQNDIAKAVFFATKAKDEVVGVLGNEITSQDVPALDILLGVSQYASALRYLDTFGIDFSSPKTSKEILSFAMGYSYHFVPEMYLATSLLNASTLLLAPSIAVNEVRNAIYPFLNIHSDKNTSNGVVDKVIKAKLVKKSVSRYSDLNIYSRKNIVILGNTVPEFKMWLMANGWEKEDFE